jgi:hypothetical protein
MKNEAIDVIRVNEVQCGRVFTRPMAKQVVQRLKRSGWPVRYVRQAHTVISWQFADAASADGFADDFYEACNEVLTPYIQPVVPTVRVCANNCEEA